MFTILRDNDGVLADTEGLYFRATKIVLETVGVHLTRDAIRKDSHPAGWRFKTVPAGTESGTEYMESGAEPGKIWTVSASFGSGAISRIQ